jgi:hypothetical protein
MNEIMIRGLIGEEDFTRILIGLPDEFFGMHKETQEALWGAVLAKINDGEMDIKKLIDFARQWVNLYPVVKAQIHKGILNF